ncbi:uncharacterized protein LOC129580840 isoform X1 [Paramacrobiotus metropolitanus]|uniref:uncharacterized protein LOC129580840 isoform X1 n=1 Tax=Paramacrobiotus metropolitanus TaxID=2943436 RepID=UPI0024458147|nr:uncharacterized protein LOC129580840 isoform X1 [Paramacrobiotus metropolitanus]
MTLHGNDFAIIRDEGMIPAVEVLADVEEYALLTGISKPAFPRSKIADKDREMYREYVARRLPYLHTERDRARSPERIPDMVDKVVPERIRSLYSAMLDGLNGPEWNLLPIDAEFFSARDAILEELTTLGLVQMGKSENLYVGLMVVFTAGLIAITAAQPFPNSQYPMADEASRPRGPVIEPYFHGFYNSTPHFVTLIMALRSPNTAGIALDVSPPAVARLDWNASLPRVTVLASTASDEFDKASEAMQREEGCRVACVDHGHCDGITHFCICEPFWTPNPFRLHYHRFETNCDWNVFVVIGVLVGIAGGLLLLSVLCHACCRRMDKKESPAYRRYRLLNEDDMEGFGKTGAGMRVPKRAQLAESDEESETVFEAKNPKYYAQNQYGTTVPVKMPKKQSAGVD